MNHAWKNRRKPHSRWSLLPLMVLAALSAATISTLIIVYGQKPFITELQLSLAGIAGVLFLMISIGLFQGIRVKVVKLPQPKSTDSKISDHVDGEDVVDAVGVGADAASSLADGADEGCVVAFLLGILVFVALFLVMILWESGILIALAGAVYWIFCRAMRQVFLKSPRCKGNLGRSIAFALLYTALYTGWLFALLEAVRRFSLKA